MGQRPQKYCIPTVFVTGIQGQKNKKTLMSFRSRAQSLKTQTWRGKQDSWFLLFTLPSDFSVASIYFRRELPKILHFARTWTTAKLVRFSSYHIMSSRGNVKLWGPFRVVHSSCWGCILCLLVLITQISHAVLKITSQDHDFDQTGILLQKQHCPKLSIYSWGPREHKSNVKSVLSYL